MTRLKFTVVLTAILSTTSSAFATSVLYVDARATGAATGATWIDAFPSLQDALAGAAAAGTPVELWVAAGTYKPDRGQGLTPGDRAATFTLRTNVLIKGGYAGLGAPDPDARDISTYVTILSGDLAGDDGANFAGNTENSCHVVTGSAVTGAGVDGCTIAGGNANNSTHGAGLSLTAGSAGFVSCTFSNNYTNGMGAGAYIPSGAAVFSACVFTGNYAYNSYGGAIYSLADATLMDCVFTSNKASYGGALCLGTGRATLRSCTFTTNSAVWGGAVYFPSGNTQVRDCIFDRNTADTGAGANVMSTCTLVGCRFTANAATSVGGGLRLSSPTATVVNCLLSGNSAKEGAGVAVDSGTTNLVNCSVSHNTATQYGGGVRCKGGLTSIRNCILWGDSAPNGPELALTGPPPPYCAVLFSNLQGGRPALYASTTQYLTWGAGNIDADPRWLRPEGADRAFGTADDNLRLREDSSAIDAGSNTGIVADAADLDGDGDTGELTPLDYDAKPRFVDDPSIADTGSGTSPIIDMGAYEGATQRLVTSAEILSIPEGGSVVLDVSLLLPPEAPVQVEVHHYSGAQELNVSAGQVLLFDAQNYSVPQQVIFEAAEDADFTYDSAVFILTAEGIEPEFLTLNEIDGAPVPPVAYVDASANGDGNGTSWANAFTELQSALAAVTNRPGTAEIRVSQGTFRPDVDVVTGTHTGDRNATFKMLNGVRITGGYAGLAGPNPDARDTVAYPTVLSGDLAGNDGPNFANRTENSQHVVMAKDTNLTASLDGVTVCSGFSYGEGGNGLLAYSSVTLESCCFVDNQGSLGAGAYITDAARISNCTFSGNKVYMKTCTGSGCRYYGSGGGLYLYRGDSVVRNCRFLNNTAECFGGGVYVSSEGSPVLINCVVSGNTCNATPNYFGQEGGGGIYVYGGSGRASITNCTITSNVSQEDGGGIYVRNLSVELGNCVVSGNGAWYGNGGGIFAGSSALELRNCTVTGNFTWGWGGGLWVNVTPTTKPRIYNTIFWRNLVDGGANQGTQIELSNSNYHPVVAFSCIQGWTGLWGGTGNTGNNPMFMADGQWQFDGHGVTGVWTEGDYHLQPGSPAVNTGDRASLPWDRGDSDSDGKTTEFLPFDISGAARVAGCTPDMGAYERAGNTDCDADGVADVQDTCPGQANPNQSDSDGDNVGDLCDTCPGTIPGARVDATGCTPAMAADTNRDGDVDGQDFGVFLPCMLGQGVKAVLPCTNMDLDKDTDVDQSDYGLFQRCWSGSGNLADPSCGG